MTIWRVFVWSKGMWRVHSSYLTKAEADEYCEMLQWKKKRAKVVEAKSG